MRYKKYVLLALALMLAVSIAACGSKEYAAADLFNEGEGYVFADLKYGMNLKEIEKKLSTTMEKAGGRKDPITGENYDDYSCKINFLGESVKLIAVLNKDKLTATSLVVEDEAELDKKYSKLGEELEKTYKLSAEETLDKVQVDDVIYKKHHFKRVLDNKVNNTNLIVSAYVDDEETVKKVEITITGQY